MMHLPLLLVQDSLLKTKTPWHNLSWIGEDGRRVCSISQHLVGEVDLTSGSCNKVTKLTRLTRTAAAITVAKEGVFVCGILSSGELFFWHTITNHVWQAKGIPEVVTHNTNPPESNVVRDFFKQLLPHNFGGNVTSDGTEQTTSSVLPHQTPKIFASSTCSKVVVVLGASQVYVWEKSLGTPLEDCPLSQPVSGSWSVAGCPGGVPLPSTHSKETQLSCCFMHEESSEECHITFTFVECLCVVVSTLSLRWRGSRLHPPAAHWNSHLVPFSALGVRENELLHTKGTLIASYAHGQSLLAVAVNSQKQHSKLVYIHPLCNTAVATNVQDGVPHFRSSNGNTVRSQWVSDLAWSHDNLYLFGCLVSGALFITTRMGPLVKISCQGEGIRLHPASTLGIQTHSLMAKEGLGDDSVQESPNITFHVSSHPNKHQVLLSSGLRVSVLSLPLDGRKEGEVVDCLLASAIHALHLLCTSAVTHDYAYIRDSTWRLAHSVLDLTQGLADTSTHNPPKISLWERRVVAAVDKAGTQDRMTAGEGELMQIEQVTKPLLAAWSLIGSHSGPHTMEWRRRAGEVVVVVMRLMTALLRITTHDDRLEHQLQLLLVLHFYHQFVRVVCVWPNSFHMMKPTLQLTHRLLHTVLACERHAGERSMVTTLLILTQTLASLEHSLTHAFTLRPALQPHGPPHRPPHQTETDHIAAGVEVTNIILLSSTIDKKNQDKIDQTVSLRLKKVWQCLHENAKKVYTQLAEKKFDQESYQKSVLVLNILQSKLQDIGCDLSERTVRLGKCRHLYLDGLYLKAIQVWKCEIMTCLAKGHGKKIIARDLHSILYAYVVHEGFSGISHFINWLDKLLRSLLCPKKQSSLPSSVKKSTKAKSDKIKLSYEYSNQINQSPKMNRIDEAATKEDDQGTNVPEMRTLLYKEVSSESRVYTFPPMERTSSQERVEVRSVSWVISAARQVMGSLGRILALETLGCCPDLPPPHKPHVIPPLGTTTTQPQRKAYLLSTVREEAGVDAAAQALALGGCWGDLAVFTSWLDDVKLTLVAGVMATTTHNKEPVPNTVLPMQQIKDLLCQPTNSTAAEFHSHQELLQLAAMTNMEILPIILEECLANMNKLTPLFQTFVPSQVHLPTPHVFCPLGPQDEEELVFHAADEHSPSEGRVRQEVGGWVRLICQVTSAAGIAYPLLLSLQHNYNKLRLMSSEEVSALVSSLGCHQEHWHPEGPEWERITGLWHQAVTLVWLLYARDKLSLAIRNHVRNASATRQNQKLHETCILEILSWVHEVNSLCEHDSWRSELVACAVTAAIEAPPCPAVAAALARVVPHPPGIPSLLRDKANRLFVTWKNTTIPLSEAESCLKGKQSEREDSSSPEIFRSLFSFYEDRCEEISQHLLSEDENNESSSFMNEYQAKYFSGTLVAGRIQEEFEKFLILFVELTFMRDVQKFPQHTSPVSLLVQFSDMLKRREFEGIKLKSRLHHDVTESTTNSLNNIDDSPCVSTMDVRSNVTTPEKKGLFRSLDYSKVLPRGSETIFISPGKRHVTSTPRNTPSVNKVLHNYEKENITKSKTTSSSRRKLATLYWQGRRSRSLSRQKKRSACVPRPRSLSISSNRGRGRDAPQHRPSNQHAEPLGWKSSQSSSNVIQHLPIKRLLHLPQHLGYNIEQGEAEDTLRLLHWMMSRDRLLCLPRVESNSCISGKLTRKVNLTLDDVMLALRWNCLSKSWLHMKNEKSHPEVKHKRLKKKKMKEERIQRTESVDVIPHNELLVSNDDDIDGNIKMEEHQDRVVSPVTCPIKPLDINSINPSSKDKKYKAEEGNGSEKDKHLYAESETESVSHSNLTERDQDRGAEDKENAQYNTETPLHLLCDSSDTKPKGSSGILSNLINIQTHNKDSIINPIEAGEKQEVGGDSKNSSVVTDPLCEDRDAHQHNNSLGSQVTKPSNTSKEQRQSIEPSSLSSEAVALEQEDTRRDTRTRKNSKIVTGQHNSRSEDSISEINYKNPSKGYQVKVQGKEAKESVPCRLPILPPHRCTNMTGVEAPDESSEPGIIPLGHLLHLPSQTTSTSKVLRVAGMQAGKNTMHSKSDQVPAEDTLDNITLPDSLHASDLEEQSEWSVSSQNIQDRIIKRNKYEPVSEKSKDGGTGLCVPLSVKKRVTYSDRCHWDQGDLNLKRVTLQTIPKDDVNASRSKTSNAKKPLKLLTLPKFSSSKKGDTKQEKPLFLKQLPIGSGYKDITKESQNKNDNAVISTLLHSKERKVEYITPLTIPKCFESYSKDDRKTKAFNFLNPHQVFAFYKQSSLKKHAENFKSLKVSKKYIVPNVQPDARLVVNKTHKEQKKSDQSSGNLDKRFLDQVKDYADKYKKGDYENILRSYKKIDEKETTVQHEAVDDKITLDQSTQNHLHLTKKTKLSKNNQTSIDTTDGNSTEKIHHQTTSNLLTRKRELANKSVNTDPYDMRQKVMKATGTQSSNMEPGGLNANTPVTLPSKSVAQTQTPTRQTVEASVFTDKSDKSESVQVDFLPPQPPPPPLQIEQVSSPPQTPPSHTPLIPHSEPPSKTGSAQGFVHIFDIPSEVVKEELKDIEMNRTIHSLDVEKGDQDASQNLFNVDVKRKTDEECASEITNKDYKEEGVFQEQTGLQVLNVTTKSKTRKHRLSRHTSHNLDKDKELHIPTPVSPKPNLIDINYENMTMDNLYEEFCSGRISFEDFYQISTNIPENEVREETLHQLDKKESIRVLAQQVSEAAQSINESQLLVEKVKSLIHEPEPDRYTLQSYKSNDTFQSNQNSTALDNISKEDPRWQEALNVYKNWGKSETLLQFLDATNFENITSDMIDEIIQCENGTQLNDDRISNTTRIKNKMTSRMRSDERSTHEDVNHYELIQNELDADSTSSNLWKANEKIKLSSSRSESPVLHLSLSAIRSSDSSHLSSLGSLLGETTSSIDCHTKTHQRRKEIRAWIKKQRQKRRQQAKSNTSLTTNMTLATTRGRSGEPNEAVSNVTPENLGLTGKQLQERSQDREVKRVKQRENHHKKREADIVKLLDDHEEEVTKYHSHVKSKLPSLSPTSVINHKKLQNIKSSINRNSQLGTKTHGRWNPKAVQDSVSQKKPGLNRYFKNSTEEWRTRRQHSLVNSPLSEDSPKERGKHRVEETSIDKRTGLQMEFYYLKRCLDSKNKHKHNIGQKDQQETSFDQSYYRTLPPKENTIESTSAHSKLMLSKENEASNSMTRDRESNSWRSLPLNATYTLPLDRISEVASNVSETSSSEGRQEVKEGMLLGSTGEDTSTDSSWTVPQDVKDLLYGSQ